MSSKQRRLARMRKMAAVKEEPVPKAEGSSMAQWRKPTKYILIIVGMLLVAYDFLPFIDEARHDTISELIAEYSLKLITLPLVFGALCGHFFFMRDETRPRPWVTVPVLVASVVIDVVSYACDVDLIHKVQHYPGIWFLLGVPIGLLFWPQTWSDKFDVDEDSGGADGAD